MKRAQKRAIVGAVVDATAAGGIFTDREEDDNTPAQEDDGPGWYEQAIEAANDFTDKKAGWKLYTDAADAHKRGLIKRWQQDYIQNTVKKRDRLLGKAAAADVEDLARQAEQTPAAENDTQPDPGRAVAEDGDQAGNGARTRTDPRAAGAASPRGAQPSPPQDGPPEDQPGSASEDQLQSLHIILGGLGFKSEDREAKLRIAETITGRPLDGGPVTSDASSKNLSFTEAGELIRKLDSFVSEDGERDRNALIAHMAEHEDYVRQETSDG
jgi:hypothetical protein